MYRPEEYIGLIQKDLKGLTSLEEKKFVSTRLETDQAFKELYEDEKIVFEAIVFSELFELENTVRNFEPKPNNKPFWIVGGILSGLVVFATLYFTFYENVEQPLINNHKATRPIKVDHAPSNVKDETRPLPQEKLPNETKSEKIRAIGIKESIDTGVAILELEDVLPSVVLDSIVETNDVIITPLKDEEEVLLLETEPNKDCPTISFDQKVIATCTNKNTGSVSVFGITGGEAPYEVLLNEEVETSNLAAGTYIITLKDNLNCVSEPKEVEIVTRQCFEEKDYVFSISQNNYFNLPVKGRFRVFNVNGQLIFDKEMEMDEQWLCIKNNGYHLTMGDYNYLISNDTGTVSGVITILE